MQTKLRCVLSVIVFLVMLPVTFAQDGRRLLPESVAQRIGVKWNQDGRAIDLRFFHPEGTWVVTDLHLEIRFVAVKVPVEIGTFKREKNNRMEWVPMPNARAMESWSERDPESPTMNVEIQPGKDAPAVHELMFNSQVASIIVKEARGREQSTFERLKSKIR